MKLEEKKVGLSKTGCKIVAAAEKNGIRFGEVSGANFAIERDAVELEECQEQEEDSDRR